MKKIHIFSQKIQLMSVALLLLSVFLAMGRPVLAADMMGSQQKVLSSSGGSHALFGGSLEETLRSDTPMNGHAMICCTEEEEKFFVSNQVSSRLTQELGTASQGMDTYRVSADQPFQTHIFSSPDEITLLSSCQKE